MSNNLWPHGLQHTRPPCPLPTPRVYSNSRPLSRWCHPTISSSVVPFSSRLPSFQASGVFLNESVLCLVLCYTKSLQSWLLFATVWTIACQGPLSMGFSRQENWGVYHALLQGIFLTQGLDLRLFHLLHRQVGSLPLALPGKLYSHTFYHLEKWWVYSRKSHKEIRSDQSLSLVRLCNRETRHSDYKLSRRNSWFSEVQTTNRVTFNCPYRVRNNMN